MSEVFILSYKNPDTDGVCSSVAYSLYAAKKGKRYKVVVAGELSEETRFVLSEASVDEKGFVREYDPAKEVVLIDTHHLTQLPHLVDPSKVIAVIDHHPGGDDEAFPNAVIDNRVVGAAASIVAETILKEGLMDERIALLLGAAIISNTVNFEAASTTEFDKSIFRQLKGYYPFDALFISNLFSQKNDILKEGYKTIIDINLKPFLYKGKIINVSQLELTNVENVLDFPEMVRVMSENRHLYGDVFMVNVIDVLQKKSYVFVAEDDEYSKAIRNGILNVDESGTVLCVDRILLRKTDFFPFIKRLVDRL